jgi:cysteine desulfurase
VVIIAKDSLQYLFMKRIYLDCASTTPADPEVVAAMLPYFGEIFGNPSSIHSFGREAKKAVDHARETVAEFIGVKPHEIIFTSGGTESNNAAIKGCAYAGRSRGDHIITSSIEHHSVLESCEFLQRNGFSVTYLPVDSAGMVDPDEVRKAITSRTILVSIMHANNEIGTIQHIAEIGAIARESGIPFHTDAVQTAGHLPIDAEALNIDLMSASAHKFYGPKGAGFLYARSGTRMNTFMHGGFQEKGRRASTHNVPGIVGLGRAVELARERMDKEMHTITALRDRLIKGISGNVKGCCLNGHPVKRLSGNVNFSFRNIEGELLLQHMDEEGIACSTGSACSAESTGPSHVLTAVGLSSDLIAGSLRLTLGRHVTEEDIDRTIEVLPKAVKKVRSMTEFL